MKDNFHSFFKTSVAQRLALWALDEEVSVRYPVELILELFYWIWVLCVVLRSQFRCSGTLNLLVQDPLMGVILAHYYYSFILLFFIVSKIYTILLRPRNQADRVPSSRR